MPAPGFVQDKVVIVTGSGGGIGRDFALALAKEGAKVVVNDVGTTIRGEGVDPSRAQAVVDEISAAGGTATANGDSVADWDAANRLVEHAIATFGRIDAVINNAGILRDRYFFNMSVEEWRAVIDVHLNGSFYVSRAAAPHFKKQESGSYIHIVSTSGLIGNFSESSHSRSRSRWTWRGITSARTASRRLPGAAWSVPYRPTPRNKRRAWNACSAWKPRKSLRSPSIWRATQVRMCPGRYSPCAPTRSFS
jgi:NAD(P)-dependent dehydrogenase (short-subunit alcohol dehydrogenase family)